MSSHLYFRDIKLINLYAESPNPNILFHPTYWGAV